MQETLVLGEQCKRLTLAHTGGEKHVILPIPALIAASSRLFRVPTKLIPAGGRVIPVLSTTTANRVV